MFLLGFEQNFLEKYIVFFPYKNLQLVYPPFDMARLMRIPMPNAMGVTTTQAPPKKTAFGIGILIQRAMS